MRCLKMLHDYFMSRFDWPINKEVFMINWPITIAIGFNSHGLHITAWLGCIGCATQLERFLITTLDDAIRCTW